MTITPHNQARIRLGLSQEQVAHLCGVCRETISRWERSHPPAIYLLALRLLADLRQASPRLYQTYLERNT